MSSFVELVQNGAVYGWLFVPTAVLLGALHGLEPGHSKTMMAAFIVAIRGTIGQAVLLALTATVSHTAIVWLLAILALTYGEKWGLEANEPYFQLVSAALIIGIAIWMIARTYRDQKAAKAASAHSHASSAHEMYAQHDHAHEEAKLIDTGHGIAELSVYEQGVAPRFRIYVIDKGRRGPPPTGQTVTVETIREGGVRETFAFEHRGEFLEATTTLPEPHEFEAKLILSHGGHAHVYSTRFAEHAHREHTHADGSKHSHDHGEHSHDAGTHNHAHRNEHGHAHGHPHPHEHAHSHTHDHDHSHADGHSHAGLSLGDENYEDAHQRAHAREIQSRFSSGNVTTAQVALFGLTGGLIPCSAAVTVLVLCLQLKQFWLGIALVLCFSIGLALTLLLSGVVAAWGMRHASRRFKGLDAFMLRAPYVSSAIIAVIGIYVGIQGWYALGTVSA